MKLGISGTGTIVQEFPPGLRTLAGLKLQALLSTPHSLEKAQRLGEAYGIGTVVDDFASFCQADIDTVYVAVPNSLHYAYCRQAFEHGLHVICEKPLATNMREAEELARLTAEKRLFLFEAITNQHMVTYQKIREWLPRVGSVKVVQSQYTQYSRRYDAFKAGDVLPVFDPAKAGGALADLGVYCLHFVLGLFGQPLAYRYYPNIERGIDTSGLMVLSYPGFQALCLTAKDCKGNAFSIVQGDKGLIRCDAPPNTLGKVVLELNDGTREVFDDGSAAQRQLPEFRDFIRAIDQADYAYGQKLLAHSLMVCRVQTGARLAAGIRFPSDAG